MNVHCEKRCCTLKYQKFTGFIDHKKDLKKYNKLKAGGILHDIKKDKLLLVQSRGKLWGFPKGTKNYDETIENCAIREIEEETGIKVTKKMFGDSIIVNNGKSTFYYIKHDEIEVEVQNSIENNDANGIGWIKVDCLKNLLKKNKLPMNRQSKIALSFFNKS